MQLGSELREGSTSGGLALERGPPELDEAWFEALHARLVAEEAPRSALEAHLLWRLARAIFGAERAARLEAEVWASGWTPARLVLAMRFTAAQGDELERCLFLLGKVPARRV